MRDFDPAHCTCQVRCWMTRWTAVGVCRVKKDRGSEGIGDDVDEMESDTAAIPCDPEGGRSGGSEEGVRLVLSGIQGSRGHAGNKYGRRVKEMEKM